jgi:hypothetical protein
MIVKHVPHFLQPLSIALLAAMPALAQETKPTPPSPAPAAQMATKAEVHACFDDEDALKARKATIEQGRSAVAAQYKQIKDESLLLGLEREKLDRKDEPTVEAFNRKNQANNDRMQTYNQSAAAQRADEAKFSADFDAYKQRCSGRAVETRVLEDVQRERAARTKP